MIATNQSLVFSVELSEHTTKNHLMRASSALSKLQRFAVGGQQNFHGLGELSKSLTFTQTSLSEKIAFSQLSLQLEEESSGTGKHCLHARIASGGQVCMMTIQRMEGVYKQQNIMSCAEA